MQYITILNVKSIYILNFVLYSHGRIEPIKSSRSNRGGKGAKRTNLWGQYGGYRLKVGWVLVSRLLPASVGYRLKDEKPGRVSTVVSAWAKMIAGRSLNKELATWDSRAAQGGACATRESLYVNVNQLVPEKLRKHFLTSRIRRARPLEFRSL